MIATPIPAVVQLYSAKQVRAVLPGAAIQFVDGQQEIFLATPAGQTFVPTANGNIVPNPGDWILNTRANFGSTVPSHGGGSFGTIVAPNSNGPFLVVTNAVFNATYKFDYAAATPNQGVIP